MGGDGGFSDGGGGGGEEDDAFDVFDDDFLLDEDTLRRLDSLEHQALSQAAAASAAVAMGSSISSSSSSSSSSGMMMINGGIQLPQQQLQQHPSSIMMNPPQVYIHHHQQEPYQQTLIYNHNSSHQHQQQYQQQPAWAAIPLRNAHTPAAALVNNNPVLRPHHLMTNSTTTAAAPTYSQQQQLPSRSSFNHKTIITSHTSLSATSTVIPAPPILLQSEHQNNSNSLLYELGKLKEENKKLTTEKYTREGEIAIVRKALKELEEQNTKYIESIALRASQSSESAEQMRSAHERELDRLVTQLKFKEQLVKQLEGKLIKLTTPPSTASSMTSRVGGLVGTTTNMTVETPPKSPGELGHVSILSNLNLNAGPSVAPPPPHPSSTTNKFITAKSFGTFRKPSALVSKGGNGHLSQQHKRQRRNIPQQKQLQQQQQQHGDGDDMMMYDDDSLMNDNDDPSTTVIDNSNNHNHFNTTSSIDDKSATTTTASNIGGGVLVAQTPPIVHVKSKAIQVENLLDHPQRGDHHDDNDGCGGRGNGDSNTEEQIIRRVLFQFIFSLSNSEMIYTSRNTATTTHSLSLHYISMFRNQIFNNAAKSNNNNNSEDLRMMSLSRKRTGLDSLNLELNPFPEFLAEPVMQFLRDPRSTERSGGVKLLMSGLFVSLSRPDNIAEILCVLGILNFVAQLSAEARRFVLTVKDEYFDFIVAILYDAQFRVDGSKMQLIPKNNSIDEAAVAAVAALALKKKKRDNAAAAANIHYWNHLDHLKGEGDEEVIEMNSQKELEALVFEHVFDFLKKILWFSHVDGGVDGVKACCSIIMKRFMTPNPVAWLLKKYSTMLDPGVLVWKGPIGNALSGCIDWCSMLLGSDPDMFEALFMRSDKKLNSIDIGLLATVLVQTDMSFLQNAVARLLLKAAHVNLEWMIDCVKQSRNMIIFPIVHFLHSSITTPQFQKGPVLNHDINGGNREIGRDRVFKDSFVDSPFKAAVRDLLLFLNAIYTKDLFSSKPNDRNSLANGLNKYTFASGSGCLYVLTSAMIHVVAGGGATEMEDCIELSKDLLVCLLPQSHELINSLD